MVLTRQQCLLVLEHLKWGGKPTCPYCGSTKATALTKENRYHCNHCYTSYSVTVNTIFHRSHVDIRKWFKAIHLFHQSPHNISGRSLAEQIVVTKNTACKMLKKIKTTNTEDRELLANISSFYQEFIDKAEQRK